MKINLSSLLVFFIFISGCEATHLVYVSNTVLGVDVAVSSEGNNRVSIGYDRDTYSLVPRKEAGKDAMSVTSVSQIRIQGLSDVQFDHFVATGKAAKKLAKDPVALEIIRRAIFDEFEGRER
jgi:hypothetical protein